MMTRRMVNKTMGRQSNVILVNTKTSHNVGTAMRSCTIFGVKSLQLVNSRFKKQASDVTTFEKHTPLLLTEKVILPYGCLPVAVEITEDAVPIETYHHHPRATYIFGPEDGSIPGDILNMCAETVKLPGKLCLNLSMAVSIVLYDRAAKEYNHA